MSNTGLRLIVFGAHPDDCELLAGGLAALAMQHGSAVKFVSLTKGDAGHQLDRGEVLARRRKREAQAAGEILGVEYEVLDYHDGELMPSLEIRRTVIRLIREWKADMVFSHRPYDYHPDHRYTGILAQDAAYLVTVPSICPDTPALSRNPFFFYLWDHFRKPYPFQADVAVAVDSVMDKKWDMIHCHTSQVYEWLPYLDGALETVPSDDAKRRQWLVSTWEPWMRSMANTCGEQLRMRYGEDAARAVRFAEPFEICEYGRKPSKEDLERLFPF